MKILFYSVGKASEACRKCSGFAVRASRGCNGGLTALQQRPRWKTKAAPLELREALMACKIITF